MFGMSKKIILLKLTGIIFRDHVTGQLTRAYVEQLAEQIKKLATTHQFCIVVGGGNFFRGSEHNKFLHVRASIAHTAGMLATMMNGLILYDMLSSAAIPTTLLCAIDCPLAGQPLSQHALDRACSLDHTIVISGGTGYPYVSTDTSAVIHAQQVHADQLWKATDVDGVYSTDPKIQPGAELLTQINYQQVLDAGLGFMDRSALVLAQQAQLATRIFNVFLPQSLTRAAYEEKFGTTIKY